MIVWFVMGIIWPERQKFSVQHHLRPGEGREYNLVPLPKGLYMIQDFIAQMSSYVRLYLPFSLLSALWNPHGLGLISDPSSKLNGKTEYVRLQAFIQAFRFLSVYVLPLLEINVTIYRTLSAVSLALALLHIVLSYTVLDLVVPRTHLTLKDNAVNLTDTLPASESDQTFARPASNNSLSISPVRSLSNDSQDSAHEPTVIGDKMEWEPSPPASRTYSPFTSTFSTRTAPLPRMFPQQSFARPREQYFSTNTSNRLSSPSVSMNPENEQQRLLLAQQRFFAPERPTGLENLFSATVRLEDEPLLVRSIKSIQRTPRIAALLISGLSLLLFPLVYYKLEAPQICLGVTLALATLYTEVSSRLIPLFLLVLWLFQGMVARYSYVIPAEYSTIRDKMPWLSALLATLIHDWQYVLTLGKAGLHKTVKVRSKTKTMMVK